MRRTTFAATAVTAATLLAGLAWAGSSVDARGKEYFKNSCRTCHSKGGPGGELTPLVKTQEQWQRYFKAGVHKNESEKLTKFALPDQLKDMETFLVNHAADSEQPATCG